MTCKNSAQIPTLQAPSNLQQHQSLLVNHLNDATVGSDVSYDVKEMLTWRRPFIFTLYLVTCNTVFWLSVFYLPDYIQTTLLVAITTIIIAMEVVASTLAVPEEWRKRRTQIKTDLIYLFDTDSNVEIFRRLFIALITLAPLRFLLRLPLVYLWHLIDDKFDHILIALLTALSTYLIENEQTDLACWAAYGAVSTFLLAVPWKEERIKYSIYEVVGKNAVIVNNKFQTHIVTPMLFYVCLHWAPPLACKIKKILIDPIFDFVALCFGKIKRLILNIYKAIVAAVLNLINAVIAFYYVCVYLVKSIINTIGRIVMGFVNAILYMVWTVVRVFTYIIDSIRRFVIFIRDSVGNAITKTRNAIVYSYHRTCECINNCVLQIRIFIQTTRDWTVYIVCCHWWPPLRQVIFEWVRKQYLVPIGEHLIRLKYVTIYVVCFHWLPKLLDYIKTFYLKPALEKAMVFGKQCQKIYIRCKQVAWYVASGELAKDLTIIMLRQIVKGWRVLRREVLSPICIEAKIQSKNIAIWSKQELLIPAVQGTKFATHQTMLYIKGSILEPAVINIGQCFHFAGKYAYENALKPTCFIIVVYFKRFQHYLFVVYWQPLDVWMHDNVLPYQDDRELLQFVPAADSADLTTDSRLNSTNASDTPLSSTRTERIDSQSDDLSQRSSIYNDSFINDDNEDDDELSEFTAGMKFNTRVVNVDSDSSDEEFSLRNVVPKQLKPKHRVRQRTKKIEVPVTEQHLPDIIRHEKAETKQTQETNENKSREPSIDSTSQTSSWSSTLADYYKKKKK